MLIKQGKTNIKYLLIVIILAVVVGGGVWFVKGKLGCLDCFGPPVSRLEELEDEKEDETANWIDIISVINIDKQGKGEQVIEFIFPPEVWKEEFETAGSLEAAETFKNTIERKLEVTVESAEYSLNKIKNNTLILNVKYADYARTGEILGLEEYKDKWLMPLSEELINMAYRDICNLENYNGNYNIEIIGKKLLISVTYSPYNPTNPTDYDIQSTINLPLNAVNIKIEEKEGCFVTYQLTQ